MRTTDGDQSGFYKHLKGMDFKGKNSYTALNTPRAQRAFGLVTCMGLIRDRWVQWFSALLNTKSPALDPNVVEEVDMCPPCTPLDEVPSIFEVQGTIKSVPDRGGVGPDELPAEPLKLGLRARWQPPYTRTVPRHCDRHTAGRGRTVGVWSGNRPPSIAAEDSSGQSK